LLTGTPRDARRIVLWPQPYWRAIRLIPTHLKTDACPRAMSDGSDAQKVVNEKAPGGGASFDDVIVGVPDAGAENVFA